MSHHSGPASFARPLPRSPITLKATPISAAFPSPQHEDESSDEDYEPFGQQKKTNITEDNQEGSTGGRGLQCSNIRCRSIRRSLDKELAFWPSSSDNPRDSVEAIMMVFDSLRRSMLQLDEKEDARKRTDLKSGALMMQNNMRIYNLKIIGPVSGVEIGYIFFFRVEMCILGLHAPSEDLLWHRAPAHVFFRPSRLSLNGKLSSVSELKQTAGSVGQCVRLVLLFDVKEHSRRAPPAPTFT